MGYSIPGYYEQEDQEERPADESEKVPMAEEEGRHGSSQHIATLEDDVREDPCNQSNHSSSKESPPSAMNEDPRPYQNLHDNSSILGDMTLFRDFFLAAFSDYNVSELLLWLLRALTFHIFVRWLRAVEVKHYLMTATQ